MPTSVKTGVITALGGTIVFSRPPINKIISIVASIDEEILQKDR